MKVNADFRRAVNVALKKHYPDTQNMDALHRKAYDTLNDYLNQHKDELLEIDILPPSLPPPEGELILQDGACLGVPKHVLILVQPTASEIFWSIPIADERVSNDTTKYEAARITLLLQTENQSAANFLKRRIRRIAEQESVGEVVNRDFWFVNSILTSPLHRHSKSPTLWYHRAWLLQYLLPAKLAENSTDTFLPFVQAEIRDVCTASERHPKNYSAWAYARKLLKEVKRLDVEVDLYREIMTYCASYVKTWCCQNPSDTSGWSFLLFVLPCLESARERRDIVEHVLRFAWNLQWKQESLWVFVRTALADDVLQEGRLEVVDILLAYRRERSEALAGGRGEDEFHGILTRTIRWIEDTGREALTAKGEDKLRSTHA